MSLMSSDAEGTGRIVPGHGPCSLRLYLQLHLTLTVDTDRFIYPSDGAVSRNIHLPLLGLLHTCIFTIHGLTPSFIGFIRSFIQLTTQLRREPKHSATMSTDKPLPFIYQFAAGAVAGVSEILIMYPLDVVKTRV